MGRSPRDARAPGGRDRVVRRAGGDRARARTRLTATLRLARADGSVGVVGDPPARAARRARHGPWSRTPRCATSRTGWTPGPRWRRRRPASARRSSARRSACRSRAWTAASSASTTRSPRCWAARARSWRACACSRSPTARTATPTPTRWRGSTAGEIDVYKTEKRYLHADGSSVWATLSSCVVRSPDGTPLHFLSQMQDVTERRRHEAELRHLADHDPLTGLLNRRSFERELERQVAQRRALRPARRGDRARPRPLQDDQRHARARRRRRADRPRRARAARAAARLRRARAPRRRRVRRAPARGRAGGGGGGRR